MFELWVPVKLPRIAELNIDFRVLLFSLAAIALTSIVFGLAPALQLARTDPAHTLRELVEQRHGYNHTDMATAAYNAAQANPALMKEVQRHGIKGPRLVRYTREGYVEADDFYNASVFDNILRHGCP